MQVLSQTYFLLPRKVSWNILNFLRLKDRYIRRRDGSLRVRCKAVLSSTLCVATLLMGTQAYEAYSGIDFDLQYAEQLMAEEKTSQEKIDFSRSFKSLSQSQPALASVVALEENQDQNTFLHNYTRIRNALSNEDSLKKKFAPRTTKITIKKGDTLAGALQRNGVSDGDTYTIVKSMSHHLDPRLIRPGQKVSLTIAPYEGEMIFSRLDIVSDPIRTIVVERDENGIIDSQLVQKEIMPKMFAAKATIENSLYGSAMKQKVPEPIVAQAIRILSWSIDFQREIRAGDELQVLYDVYVTDEGEYVRSGEPHYIKLTQADNEVALYLHEFADGRKSYFRENGHSAKKGLLRTLVDGARLSSGFGMRRHPVLGYGKMHKGLDFAAARGTPVYAAGDGVVKRASRFGAYGNYIKIRHNTKLETAYAHLKSYAKGVKAGKRIKQGQVIGYVGTTGRSTGPHLHYEVLVNGKQANPRSVKVPTGEILTGKSLQALKSTIRKYDRKFATLIDHDKFAANTKSFKSNPLN